MRMREPDQLGIERPHPPLALALRIVQLAEPDSHVTGDHGRPVTRVDDDHLNAPGVPRSGNEPDAGQELELAVDGNVLHAGWVDPLADRVVLLGPRVLEFLDRKSTRLNSSH